MINETLILNPYLIRLVLKNLNHSQLSKLRKRKNATVVNFCLTNSISLYEYHFTLEHNLSVDTQTYLEFIDDTNDLKVVLADNSTLKVLNLKDLSIETNLLIKLTFPDKVKYLGNNKLLITENYGYIAIYDIQIHKFILKYYNDKPSEHIEVINNSSILFAFDSGLKIKLINTDTNDKLTLGNVLIGNRVRISCLKYLKTQGNLLSGNFGNEIICWDINSASIIRIYNGHESLITCLVSCKCDEEFISVDLKGAVKNWKLIPSVSNNTRSIQNLHELIEIPGEDNHVLFRSTSHIGLLNVKSLQTENLYDVHSLCSCLRIARDEDGRIFAVINDGSRMIKIFKVDKC